MSFRATTYLLVYIISAIVLLTGVCLACFYVSWQASDSIAESSQPASQANYEIQTGSEAAIVERGRTWVDEVEHRVTLLGEWGRLAQDNDLLGMR